MSSRYTFAHIYRLMRESKKLIANEIFDKYLIKKVIVSLLVNLQIIRLHSCKIDYKLKIAQGDIIDHSKSNQLPI